MSGLRKRSLRKDEHFPVIYTIYILFEDGRTSQYPANANPEKAPRTLAAAEELAAQFVNYIEEVRWAYIVELRPLSQFHRNLNPKEQATREARLRALSELSESTSPNEPLDSDS